MGALEHSIPQPGPPSGADQGRYVPDHVQAIFKFRRRAAGHDRLLDERLLPGVEEQPILDFQRFANNRRAVGNYCKKNGGETVMSAI